MLARNIVLGSIAYLILTFWHVNNSVPLPNPLNLLDCTNITLSFVRNIHVFICEETEVKMFLIQIMYKLFQESTLS